MKNTIHLFSICSIVACIFSCSSSYQISNRHHTITHHMKNEYWSKTTDSIDIILSAAKKSQPELIVFLKKMPKGADLHNHLSGATYSEYQLQSAQSNGLYFNTKTFKFVRKNSIMPPEDSLFCIPSDSLASKDTFLQAFLNVVSMRGWYPNTNNGHDHFFNTFNYIGTSGRTTKSMLGEVAHRNIIQNIQHIELMTGCIPQSVIGKFANALPDSAFNPNNLQLAFDRIKPLLNDKSILDSIRSYTADLKTSLADSLKTMYGYQFQNLDSLISVRFIYQLYRNGSLAAIFRNAVIASLAINNDSNIVALNLVQAEDNPISQNNFTTQMKTLDFVWNSMNHPTFALHAGELVLNGSPLEAMRSRIRNSITIGHAQRIGHGISIAWDDNVSELCSLMVRKGILVEICLSSNESILNITGRNHPFILYREKGVPVCLNTDDEGVSRSNLTMEFVKAVENYNLSYAELKELVYNSIKYSFLDSNAKKMQLYRLDQKFIEFEKYILTYR